MIGAPGTAHGPACVHAAVLPCSRPPGGAVGCAVLSRDWAWKVKGTAMRSSPSLPASSRPEQSPERFQREVPRVPARLSCSRAAPPRRVPFAYVLRRLGELVSCHTDSKRLFGPVSSPWRFSLSWRPTTRPLSRPSRPPVPPSSTSLRFTSPRRGCSRCQLGRRLGCAPDQAR
jgi:hypothetical protein